MPDQALSHLKVLDLTHYVAGPYCTKLLADFGADVLKVERPGDGDGARRIGPFLQDDPHPEKSGLFLYLNTNKKGITLNLKTDTGKQIFKRLAEDVDVLVENFEPRVMPGLGLGYDVLRQINPKLVMTSISNFGQTGPYRDYRSSDLVAIALGGFLYLVGDPDREPLKTAGYQAQYHAGLNGAAGTLTATYARGYTGKGQHVEVSMHECIASILGPTLPIYTRRGVIRYRVGNRQFEAHPQTVLRCKDGWVAMAMVQPDQWDRLAKLMAVPGLDDPKFATDKDRYDHADELDDLMLQWLTEHTGDDIDRLAEEHRLPMVATRNTEKVFKSPHYKERGFFVEIEREFTGKLSYPGAPFKMSETPWQCRRPAPTLGQHNEEVYCGRLGYSKQDLVSLREAGVI